MTLLEARNVSAGYGVEPVVRGVSLGLAAGESLAVVGPNAAGKSTLLRAIAGAMPLRSGEVLLGADRLDTLHGRERARRLALVPQSARYDLEFTVREIVALGRAPHTGAWGLETPEDHRVIDEAIREADLEAIASRPFVELSGGERQRALFARALAQASPVLLLDEPTAHLDLAHQLLVVERVEAHVAQGGAALVVLHDLALAARLQRVAVLERGGLVALGRPAEVLTPQRLAQTWGVDGALAFSEGRPSLVVSGRARGRD